MSIPASSHSFRELQAQLQPEWGNPTMGATVAAMMFLIILTGVLLYMFLWARRVQTYDL